MSTYLPTIKQLQYLVALHEQQHFGRAAAHFVARLVDRRQWRIKGKRPRNVVVGDHGYVAGHAETT